MNRSRRILAAAFVAPTLALLAACGGDSDSAASSAPAPATTSSAAPESTDAQSTDSGATDATSEAPAPAGEYVPNHIILGTDGIQVTPSVQCGIFDENTVSIAGVGRNDASIEFAFDVFDANTTSLSLTTADGVQWSSVGTLSYRLETDTRVTGLTELQAETGGDAKPVSFAFSCE